MEADSSGRVQTELGHGSGRVRDKEKRGRSHEPSGQEVKNTKKTAPHAQDG